MATQLTFQMGGRAEPRHDNQSLWGFHAKRGFGPALVLTIRGLVRQYPSTRPEQIDGLTTSINQRSSFQGWSKTMPSVGTCKLRLAQRVGGAEVRLYDIF